MTDPTPWLYWAVVVCFGYLLAVYVASAVLLIASLAEHVYQTRQTRTQDDETMAASAFTIPVSVLAPMYNEEVIVGAAVQSFLDLQYPDHEVIVVNDGSSDGTLDVLKRAFDLEPRAIFYRHELESRPPRGVYVSRTHPNLIVVDKENGGKADALNCALNFARYRYICTVDGDTLCSPDALLNGMRPALQDPALVVGVSSAVAIHRHPEDVTEARSGFIRIDRHPFTSFQLLDFLRTFLNTRLGSTRWRFMLCASGAFALWRREVVIALGGFSTGFTCEDIELTFRVHEAFRRRREPYRIVSLGTIAGTTERPPTLGALISQRARWQRVILETVWAYRRMFLNPRYGSVGTLGVPHYVLTEVLAPLVEVLALVVFVAAWWQDQLDVPAVQLLCIVAFTNGILTNAAILLHDMQTRLYPVKDLVWLILLGPLDLLVYRPVIFLAQTKGLVDFIRGDKGWHKFARHQRRVAGAP